MNSPHCQTNSKLSIWLQAARPFSFTASITPVLIGAALSPYYKNHVTWVLLPLAAIAALLLHAGTNLISDYFDFKNGVDKDYTFGSSKVLVNGLLEPKQLLFAAWIVFSIVCILGMILVAVRGIPLLIIGIIGLLGGYLYTGRPVGYKYIALGDICVFVLMGPLMVIGSYLTLTGVYDPRVLYVSLPIGFLVTAILHANNLRDIAHDRSAGVKTVASILGQKGAKLEYIFLISAAYISILILTITKVLPLWSNIVLLSVPMAIKNIKAIEQNVETDPENLALIDEETAKFHFLFGVLLIISIAVGTVLS